LGLRWVSKGSRRKWSLKVDFGNEFTFENIIKGFTEWTWNSSNSFSFIYGKNQELEEKNAILEPKVVELEVKQKELEAEIEKLEYRIKI